MKTSRITPFIWCVYGKCMCTVLDCCSSPRVARSRHDCIVAAAMLFEYREFVASYILTQAYGYNIPHAPIVVKPSYYTEVLNIRCIVLPYG